MNTTVPRRILGWRPGRTRPEPVSPWWDQWAAAPCMALAPTRSGKSDSPGPVLATAHKGDLLLCGAGAKVPRS